MIPQQTIEQIIQSADIVTNISDYVKLRQAGANYKCVCPFHEDHDASLVVSPTKKLWKCFGCGAGGNIISFVQRHETVSFPEAVTILGKKYNIPIPQQELSDEEKQQLLQREALYIVLHAAQEHFSTHITDKDAISYLASRDILAENMKAYGAGFAPKDFTLLAKSLTQKGYKTKTLIAAGLLNPKNDKIYDRFINRITFPFYDLSGRIIGFTGRALPEEGTDTTAKYLNSPDTALFKKGETLFGLYQARQFIQQADKVYLVEGQFDVLSMAAAGYKNVVCGSGTAFTKEQAILLRKFTDNVTLIYDGDPAGVKAAIRNIDILLINGLKVRAVILPKGEDPDTFIRKKGKEKLNKWLQKNEISFIAFLWKIYEKELSDPIRKTEVSELVAKSIACAPSPIARNNYISDLAARFHADEALLRSLVSKLIPETITQKPDIETVDQGIYGIDEARTLIGQTKKELTITFEPKIFAEDWGSNPTVLIVGTPSATDIQDIRSISYVINCRDTINIGENIEEPPCLQFLKKLHISGFTVSINKRKNNNTPIEYEVLSFTEFYVYAYSFFKGASEYAQNTAIKRCAELLSHADSITLNVRMKDYAMLLGISKLGLEKVVKPFLDKRKSEERFNIDVTDDDDILPFSSSRLPDYVSDNPELMRIYNQHGFFPLLDKKERKIAYVFRQKNAFLRVGNFYIEPLLHIYDKNSEANKRVVELTQRRIPYPIYMEWISKEMITMQSFRQRLWEEGDINFT